MSYRDIQVLLKESKENAPTPKSEWLMFTKKEGINLRKNWRNHYEQQWLSSLYEDQILNKDSLKLFASHFMKSPLISSKYREKFKEIWNDTKMDVDEKAAALIKIARHAGYFDPPFIKYIPRFLKLFSNDDELFDFLSAPQQFIKKHQFTSYQKQILEFVSRDNSLEYLSIGKYRKQKYESDLTEAMKKLNLQNYGCRDARSFETCINPSVKDDVLEKSKKMYIGPTIIGMAGASDDYSRQLIKSTAKVVEKTKMGECHTFAQLAAEHLLKLVESKELSGVDVKIVSHDAKLGSHTFLLINHTGDLSDLSKCLIVDPWAYAMGYTATNGIFTMDNYPYPGMTTNLQCCYNSTEDLEHLNRLYGINPVEGDHDEPVNAEQARQFIEYLYGGVQNLVMDANKEALIKQILKDLSFDEISPSKAMKIATDVYFAAALNGDDYEGYSWTQRDNFTDNLLGNREDIKEFFVEAFNRYPEVKSFWTNYLQQKHQGDTLNTDKITVDLILQIGQDLANDDTLDHQYTPQNPDTVFRLE